MARKLIIMTQKELSRYEIIQRLIKKEINGAEAAKQLSLSIRQIKRIKAKVKKHGINGIIHKNRGKIGNRKTPDEKIKEIKTIIRKNYSDFKPTFAKEKLEENHQIKVSKEKLRQLMTKWDLWKPKPRKTNKEYRSWRQRKEQYGEMEQFDGSYHAWFENRAPSSCLLASIDDAKGEITGLKFVHWEGVKPCFAFWQGYILKYGKPLKIYLDRHSTYKQNQKSVFDDPKCLTQFERAMRELNIEIIHAYSPQAKGRVERLFKTLQDRLVKELRLANISKIKEANKFVEQTFIPKFNKQFAVLPQKPGNLHRKLTKIEETNLGKIFSVQDQRIVNNDFTVRYKKIWFQLSEIQPTLVLRKDKVQIEESIDDQIFVSLKNKRLNYEILPERPKRIAEMDKKITGLTRTKTNWRPPIDHPWRKSLSIYFPKRY